MKWDEYNMLISGLGFWSGAIYPYGIAQGQGRYLNVRVLVPREGWNGKLYFWHHGNSDTQMLMYTSLIEPELLLSRGWAVAMAQFNGIVPAQQNPNATDGSYWKAVDEMFLQDPNLYWRYQSHPDWWHSNGSPIRDGATLRNIVNLCKNLLYRQTGMQPAETYWVGWSLGGLGGLAVASGRDPFGAYTGGNFNVPYDPASGKVFDGFAALEPVYSATAPVDPEYPVTAPFMFFDGSVTLLGLSWPNALNYAHKAKDALDLPAADPSLSQDIDDWVRLYMQHYGDHDWTGRFYETVYSGADHPVYLDISQPADQRLNTEGRGRKLTWFMTELNQNSPVYTGLWIDENVPGWGQISFTYYLLNDGYHLALFEHLVNWAANGVAPPPSRIDPYLLDPALNPATAQYPDLPVNDPLQDSLDRPTSGLSGSMQADLIWQRDSGLGLAADPSMVPMPHVTARTGILRLGYKIYWLTPFTHDQLINGYHYGNIDFAGYADYDAYLAAFTGAVQALVNEGLYDPEIAEQFSNGDPALPMPPF